MSIKNFLEKLKNNNSCDIEKSDVNTKEKILKNLLEIQHQIEHFNDGQKDFKSIVTFVDNIKEKIFSIMNDIEENDMETTKKLENILHSLNMILVEAYNKSIHMIMNLDKKEAKNTIIKLQEEYINYDGNSRVFINKLKTIANNILEDFDNIYKNYHSILCGKAKYDGELLSICIN